MARDVFDPNAKVIIGGQTLDLVSASTAREMADNMPGGGTLGAATAEAVAVYGEDVTETIITPWDPSVWPPAISAPSTVQMDMGDGYVQNFVGTLVGRGGDLTSRTVDLELSDNFSSFDRQISMNEMSDRMPHPDEGAQDRFTGLHTMYVTDAIFRNCGWYATPPNIDYCVLSVPAMGSMWPEVGTLETCISYDPAGEITQKYPIFYVSEWGLAVSYVTATYTLGAPYILADRGHMELVAVSQIFTSADRNAMSLEARTDAGGGVRLTWSETTAYVWWADSTGWTNTGVSVPNVTGLLYVQIDYVTDTSIRVTLENEDGVTDTGTVTVPTSVTRSPYRTALIEGDEFGGGFQIGFPFGTQGSLEGWEPTALIHRRRDVSHMIKAHPPIEGENCLTLLKQQAEAEAATFWIDEDGVLQWWHLDRLEEAQPSQYTFNSDKHITEAGFKWSDDPGSIRSSVVVNWKDWARQNSYRSTIDFWQGDGTTIEPGQEDAIQAFIEVPDDEVWLGPDLAFTRVGDWAGAGATMTDFNKGRRSWWGGVIEDGDEWAWFTGSLAFTIQRINGATFKYSMRWTGDDTVELKTPNANAQTEVSRNKRSMDLPILRGKGKYTYTDMEYRSSITGPSYAKEMVVDAGFWIQEVEQAQRVADYYASKVTVPQPLLSSVGLVLEPGVRLGDKITIEENRVSHLTILGLVIEDARTLTAQGAKTTHSVRVRPIAVSRNGRTWEDWGAYMDGAQWQQWGARMDGAQWQTWGGAPLAY